MLDLESLWSPSIDIEVLIPDMCKQTSLVLWFKYDFEMPGTYSQFSVLYIPISFNFITCDFKNTNCFDFKCLIIFCK